MNRDSREGKGFWEMMSKRIYSKKTKGGEREKRLVYCWISLLHSLTADTLQRSKVKPSERLVQRFWFILTSFLGFR